MFARVSTYRGEGDSLREGFDSVTEQLKQLEGFDRAYFLIGEDGKAMSITLWESREALDASVEAANRLRDSATQPSGAQIRSVDSYEVAITV